MQFSVGPDLFGMSGAGVWCINPRYDFDSIKPSKKLVAILTEWPIRNKKLLVGTRIDIFTEMLRKDYNFNIVDSKIIKLQ
ncbi:MAG: hypothetical protein IPK08_17180 [Bacteroidetes bacterium]|nr:hypothetical protein [Bacteroidota bacterium]